MDASFFLRPRVSRAENGLFHASLLPHWIPQAQFAGYMMAQDKGFYRDAGLDLTLMRGGPESQPLELLRKGQVTFCTQWVSTAIRSRANGVPVVNIGQIVQRSALMLIARKSSGIKILSDLDGKSIGCWEGDFRIQPLALFRMNDLTIRLVPMYETVNLFLKGGVSALAAMWYNEYHTILNSGLNKNELTTFFFSDLGLNFPEDGLYCMAETLNAHPDICRKFVDASLQGMGVRARTPGRGVAYRDEICERCLDWNEPGSPALDAFPHAGPHFSQRRQIGSGQVERSRL